MSHCREPETCSVCLGIPARRISPDGQTIDGVHTPRDIPVQSDHGGMPRTKPEHRRRRCLK